MGDCMMPVTIGDKVEMRRIVSTGKIQLQDGSEIECIRHPELLDGEFASYSVDGRVTIYRGHKDQ